MLTFNTSVAELQLRHGKPDTRMTNAARSRTHWLSTSSTLHPPLTDSISCHWHFLNIAPDSENKTQPFKTWTRPTVPSSSITPQSLKILNSHHSNFKLLTECFIFCPVSGSLNIQFLLPTILFLNPLPPIPTLVFCDLRISILSH